MSKGQTKKTREAAGNRRKLTRAEKKQIAAVIRQAKGDGKAHTAQQTIPYLAMYPDGICKVAQRKYSKSIAFEDINYQLAQADDKTAIFENWCDFLNYFDASVNVQLSFINQGSQQEQAARAIHIPPQNDDFNSIRTEYSDMLKSQLAKGNNGLVKHKYITFSIEADNPAAARARLSRIETDVLSNFKVLGVSAHPLSGYERLKVLHGVLKSDFILSLCELVIGGKEGLQPVDKTVIDRAVRNVYRDYLADPVPEKMPILGDLYDELLKQPEPEAARIAAALELYVSGSLNVFNHRTNVELNNRLVCFDIKQLGKQLKKLGMLIVQDQIWNRVTINRAEKKSTRYYMDEFHLLLKEEQTAAYSVEIWKRFRKWGGIPTAITQNIKDLLASREVENIFENSDFVLMLNQAQGDRAILAKQLNISPQQMKYVTHTEAGEGLIFYGNVVLPFVDHFPKDTELYRIMTTKPEEVSSL